MTKKQIKALKKEITEHSATTVGYYYSIFEAVDALELIRVVKDLTVEGLLSPNNASTADWDNFVLTEYIRRIGYQAFKSLVPHFIGC